MTNRSPMHQQIDTLPDLLRAVALPFDQSARATFDFELCTSLKRIFLVGCGDSYHACYGAELAFHQFAGVPAQAFSALTFSRYQVGYLPETGPNTNLAIAVSVSGVVSRCDAWAWAWSIMARSWSNSADSCTSMNACSEILGLACPPLNSGSGLWLGGKWASVSPV